MLKHDKLYLKGIFVQRSRKGFCVTFPRLGNLSKEWENEFIYPSETFKTFLQAFKYALNAREQISMVRACPIVNYCDINKDKAYKSYAYSYKGKVIA